MKKMGSLGLLGLVIVLAVVLTLVAKQWQAVAPVAAELPADSVASDDSGNALGPGLSDMRATTSGHSDDVQEAMQAID